MLYDMPMRPYELEMAKLGDMTVLTVPRLLCEHTIRVAFTTRRTGVSPAPYDSLNLALNVGDDPGNVLENRARLATALAYDEHRLTCAEQAHSANTVVIGSVEAGAGWNAEDLAMPGCDGLLTDVPETPLAVFTADCVPVVLAAVKKRAVAVVHAGWKGIYLEIVAGVLRRFRDVFSAPAGDLLAFIGPCIGIVPYEVPQERIDMFRAKFGEKPIGEGRHLDLAGIVTHQLLEAGLASENVVWSGYCTYCRSDLFFSYRRDGATGRQAAVAMLM